MLGHYEVAGDDELIAELPGSISPLTFWAVSSQIADMTGGRAWAEEDR